MNIAHDACGSGREICDVSGEVYDGVVAVENAAMAENYVAICAVVAVQRAIDRNNRMWWI